MSKVQFIVKEKKEWCKCWKSLFCCYGKNEDVEYLVNVVHENTVTFVPPITVGKVIKVYDGDTFTLISKLPYKDSQIYRFSIRLNGIDSPEIKGKSENEKVMAKLARDALSKLIMGKIVTLKNVSLEKYGRVLADVYIGELYVNEWMIQNNYAVKYDGGTKVRSIEWD